MVKDLNGNRSTAIPCLRYRAAAAAIEWLCEAFLFEEYLVVPGEESGTIAHAQLVSGNGMIMLGSADSHGGREFDPGVRPPEELGGLTSQIIYGVVEDVDAHHDRAVARGAELVHDLEDQEYGGRGYSCVDPEGNIWSFGTYDLWQPA
jgi:uncharacterized glyoxalase superfamily protein PhnB